MYGMDRYLKKWQKHQRRIDKRKWLQNKPVVKNLTKAERKPWQQNTAWAMLNATAHMLSFFTPGARTYRETRRDKGRHGIFRGLKSWVKNKTKKRDTSNAINLSGMAECVRCLGYLFYAIATDASEENIFLKMFATSYVLGLLERGVTFAVQGRTPFSDAFFIYMDEVTRLRASKTERAARDLLTYEDDQWCDFLTAPNEQTHALAMAFIENNSSLLIEGKRYYPVEWYKEKKALLNQKNQELKQKYQDQKELELEELMAKSSWGEKEVGAFQTLYTSIESDAFKSACRDFILKRAFGTEDNLLVAAVSRLHESLYLYDTKNITIAIANCNACISLYGIMGGGLTKVERKELKSYLKPLLNIEKLTDKQHKSLLNMQRNIQQWPQDNHVALNLPQSNQLGLM